MIKGIRLSELDDKSQWITNEKIIHANKHQLMIDNDKWKNQERKLIEYFNEFQINFHDELSSTE